MSWIKRILILEIENIILKLKNRRFDKSKRRIDILKIKLSVAEKSHRQLAKSELKWLKENMRGKDV